MQKTTRTGGKMIFTRKNMINLNSHKHEVVIFEIVSYFLYRRTRAWTPTALRCRRQTQVNVFSAQFNYRFSNNLCLERDTEGGTHLAKKSVWWWN